MKNKILKEYKPHLRTRTYLEFLGLAVLIAFSIVQWPILRDAFSKISASEPVFLLLALALYWLLLPLTAMSFQILSIKKINIFTTTLAQLAGSGPGRIIPGGLGRISLSVLHLRKLGIETSKSIIITVTSNIIGVVVTVLTVAGFILFGSGTLSESKNYSIVPSILTLLFLTLAVFALFQWAMHAHRTRKSILKFNRQWREQIRFLARSPQRIVKLCFIALLILSGNAAILLFCAYALNVNISISDALFALSAGVFIGGILPTPGGVGGVEAGITGILIVLGYSPSDSAGIAVLYRAITYIQPLVPGIFAYLYLRQRKLL